MQQSSKPKGLSNSIARIGPAKRGIPKDAIGLSIRIKSPHVTGALKSHGITVDRKRTPTKRLLQVTSITQ